jgi:hypothetical protein
MPDSRLKPVARVTLQALALTLGVAAALALVSCGKRDTKGLLPGDTASQIVSNLDQIKADAAAGDCTSAAAEVGAVQDQIDNLPSSVDSRLRTNLEQGAQALADKINSAGACEATTEATTTTRSTTEKTTTTKPKTTTTTEPTSTTTSTSTTSTLPTSPTTTVPIPPTGGTGTPGGTQTQPGPTP